MYSLNITTSELSKISNEIGAYLFIFNGFPIAQLIFWSHKLKDWCCFSAERAEYEPFEFDINDFNRIRELIKLGYSDNEALVRVLGLQCN